MAYRVIQWATGNVGRAAIEGIRSHPELELVGCWVHGEKKSGRDVGEICGLGSLGVTATHDADALLGMDADCILYSPLSYHGVQRAGISDRRHVLRVD